MALPAASGSYNLNNMPRSQLLWRQQYTGRRIPAVTSGYRFAGVFTDNPVNRPNGMKGQSQYIRPQFMRTAVSRYSPTIYGAE
jgi:hypothetical protein